MNNRPAASPRLPLILLLSLVIVSALVGGVVARMLPTTQVDPGPRILAGPADDSLAPLVRKTSPAVVNIATLLPSPAEQNPLLHSVAILCNHRRTVRPARVVHVQPAVRRELRMEC